MKICAMGAEFSLLTNKQTDRQTDMVELFVAFRNSESESNKNKFTCQTKVKLFDMVRFRCNSYSSIFPFFISNIP